MDYGGHVVRDCMCSYDDDVDESKSLRARSERRSAMG